MFSKRVRADIALAVTALIWGSTFVVVKDALADVSVFVYLAVRFAMAAVEINTLSTSLMGVDARRLAAVAAWPKGTTHASVAAVGRALTPRTASDVILANGALSVSAAVSASGAARRDLAHLDLEAWLFDPLHGSRTVDLGRLRPGRSTC